MKRTNVFDNCRKKLRLYLAFLVVLSLSFVLMPVAVAREQSSRVFVVMVGATCWIGLIGTVCTAIRLNIYKRKNLKIERSKFPGIINFFSNKYAIVIDMLMIISILVFLLSFIIDLSWISFISFAFLVFSFGSHCVFNGGIGRYLVNKDGKGDK